MKFSLSFITLIYIFSLGTVEAESSCSGVIFFFAIPKFSQAWPGDRGIFLGVGDSYRKKVGDVQQNI